MYITCVQVPTEPSRGLGILRSWSYRNCELSTVSNTSIFMRGQQILLTSEPPNRTDSFLNIYNMIVETYRDRMYLILCGWPYSWL